VNASHRCAATALLAGLLAACDRSRPRRPGELPESTSDVVYLAPDAPPEALEAAVEEGLATPERGWDYTRFVVVRDGARYGPAYNPAAFHVVIGAGRELPAGALAIRRSWAVGGQIVDGQNEEVERCGIAVCVERGASRPYAGAVLAAGARFVAALTRRVPIHPDCIVAMPDVPYAASFETDAEERRLAAEMRAEAFPPRPTRTLQILAGERVLEVPVEVRDSLQGIATGLMLRREFRGHGMLFVYPHRDMRSFWARNCFVPIDVAYIYDDEPAGAARRRDDGTIDQIATLDPKPGAPRESIPRVQSRSHVRYVLEMPGGWFAEHGVREGARVTGLPAP
jgi:uncharacterized membrane protein (UPF0127 family)